MEKRIRNRVIKDEVKLNLIKLLPLIFVMILFLVSTSVNPNFADGPYKPGID